MSALEVIMRLPTSPKNPSDFPEGSVIRSIYSGKVYVVSRHYSNGMCNLFQPDIRVNENWNACNNRHFIPADYVSLCIRSLI